MPGSGRVMLAPYLLPLAAVLFAYGAGLVLDLALCAWEEARWIKATARRNSRASAV